MLRGSDTGYLLDTPTRKKIDLSGQWLYSIRGGDEGSVKIPSAYDFTGEVTFQREVSIDPADLDEYLFHIVMFGSNYSTVVNINTDFVTQHLGGYTSFTAPIPADVLRGSDRHTIRITTNNTLDATRTLPVRHGVWEWRNYGGIFRDVFLLATPKIYISDVFSRSTIAPDLQSARIAITVSVDEARNQPDSSGRLLVVAELYEKLSNALVATSASVELKRLAKEWMPAELSMVVNSPRLWSPDSPDLYFLKTYLVDAATGNRIDEHYLNIGLKHLEVKDGRFVLNGDLLLLKGMFWAEDHPRFGSAMTPEEMEKDVVMMKAVGTNAIRFGHHPPHPYMINLCDRYGLLALVEIPVKGVPASILTNDYFLELANNSLREMIIRDRTHVSVLAWGLGDEFESSNPLARKYVESLLATAKKLDTRLVYYSSRFLFNDACADLVDLRAVSLSTRDTREFRSTIERLRSANPDRPVIITRMGVEVDHRNEQGYADPLSQQAQARYFIQHFEVVRGTRCDGAFVWSFNDWRGDRPALSVNTGNPWMHTVGVVSYAREKRLAYDAIRSAYSGDKFVALQMGSHPSSAPIVYVLSGLVLLVGTAYLYNANRRFREGLNRSVVNSYNFFSDVRDQRIVTVFHSTLLGLIVSGGVAIVLSSLLYHFRESLVLDNVLSLFLVSDAVKEHAVRLIRDPQIFLPVVTGVFFVLLLLVFVLVMIIAPAFRARIYPFHAYAVTMWSTPPLLVLVPLGMILFRLMETQVYVLPAILLVILLFKWVFFRFLKGVSIILDAARYKVYTLGILSAALIVAGGYLYLDQTQSVSVYMNTLLSDIVSRVR